MAFRSGLSTFPRIPVSYNEPFGLSAEALQCGLLAAREGGRLAQW